MRLLGLRVVGMFCTECHCRSYETLSGISGHLDHDAASYELLEARSGHEIKKGPEEDDNEDNFDNWK